MTLLTHWEGRPVDAWRASWEVPHLEIHDALGSTNDRAKELARNGKNAWAAVLAETQTRGRGREGRAWVSPAGQGLWLSVLVPSKGLATDGLLPLRVGLASAEALEGRVGRGLGVQLKWPNDLLLSGKKVGGVLCENTGSGIVVAGLGLNVGQKSADFPPELRETAISLEEGVGSPVPRGELAGVLIRGIKRGVGDGGEHLTPGEMEGFSRRDVLLGQQIESQQEGLGVAVGITPSGSLIMEAEVGGRREIRGGSVRQVIR
ncbi:MAG: biotin--[acetyl-CoA-carboxylase] ligase [Longimicrobiales bacterium]